MIEEKVNIVAALTIKLYGIRLIITELSAPMLKEYITVPPVTCDMSFGLETDETEEPLVMVVPLFDVLPEIGVKVGDGVFTVADNLKLHWNVIPEETSSEFEKETEVSLIFFGFGDPL